MIFQKQNLTGWAKIEYNLMYSLGLIYDPDDPKYRDAPRPDKPPTPTKAPTKTTGVVGDNVKYSVKTGTWQREIVAESTDNNADKPPTAADKPTDKKSLAADKLPTGLTTNWFDVLKTPTNTAQLNTDRQPLLTREDLKLVHEWGLDEAKAQTIKDYWYKGISRRKAAKLLTVTSKGYSDSIVKDYYTIFNRTIKEAESPTLKEK